MAANLKNSSLVTGQEKVNFHYCCWSLDLNLGLSCGRSVVPWGMSLHQSYSWRTISETQHKCDVKAILRSGEMWDIEPEMT